MNARRIEATRKMLKRTLPHTTTADIAVLLDSLMSAILEEEKTVTLGSTKPNLMLVDIDAWGRIDEVRNYARFHDVDMTEAIRRLVNSGLSHEHRGWTS